jgi:hypothetical protein
MSMDYIRRSYGVPAKRGARVTWWDCMTDRQVQGTIVGARGHYLRIRFDDEARTRTLHPTWRIGYHETPNVAIKPRRQASA